MKILLKLILLIICLFGLTNGSAPKAFNNGFTGSHKILLQQSNFGFCDVGTIDTDGQVFNLNFDQLFSQLTFNVTAYFNTSLDTWTPLDATTAATLKFDTIIQSVIYESINEVGFMYAQNTNKTCATALAHYMCSVTFPKENEQACRSLCTNIDTECIGEQSFVFDYVTSFTQVFPSQSQCAALPEATVGCSSSGNTLEGWVEDQTQTAVLFYLYPEDYPTCSFSANPKEGYRYIYPDDLFATPFIIVNNYTQDESFNKAFVSNLNNVGTNCNGCGNCTESDTSASCEFCNKCVAQGVGTYGQECSDCQKNAKGEWLCYDCKGSRGTYNLDASIRDALFAGNNKNGFEYQIDANYDCVEILLTYLCTYTFRERGQLPCNSVCSATNATVYKCPKSFVYTFDEPTEILPNIPECEAKGARDNQGCSAISFLKVGNPFGWRYLYDPNPDYQKHPGGIVKGSVLGFGVLVGLLLVIASLGFIMKQQSKK